MAGQAAAVLAGADVIPAWGYQLWDTSRILSQDSLAGRALRALIGYADRPMGVQLAAYFTTLSALVVGSRLVRVKPSDRARLSLVASPSGIAHLEGRHE
jgi:high-affinity iron transporter